MQKPTLHALDFDGTITTRDTFLAFLRFVAGNRRFLAGLFRCAPAIARWKLHLIPTQKAKEAVFAHFCAGMSLTDFNALCKKFAEQNAHLLRPLAVQTIRTALASGDTVLIVSASIENYIAPFFADWGKSVLIEATKVEADENGFLTGRFLGANCKGAEKVRRIQRLFPDRTTYTLIAYGDSAGDREMLAFANETHYKPFRSIAPAQDTSRKSSLAEKLRFLFVGVVAVIVQYAAYRVLLRIALPAAAYTLAYAVSLAVNFTLSTLFTFRVKPSVRRAAGFAISHAVNYTLQIALLHLFIKIGIHRNLAPIPVYAVCVPINFVLVKFFLTKTRR